MLLQRCWRGPQRLAFARFDTRQILSLYHGQQRKPRRHLAVGSAAAAEAPSADLIPWPEGLKPKRGVVTKAALLKLKVGCQRLSLASISATACIAADPFSNSSWHLLTSARLKVSFLRCPSGPTTPSGSSNSGSFCITTLHSWE